MERGSAVNRHRIKRHLQDALLVSQVDLCKSIVSTKPPGTQIKQSMSILSDPFLFVLTANATIPATIAPSTAAPEKTTDMVTDAPTTLDQTTTLTPVQTTKDILNVTDVAPTESPSTIKPEASTGFNFTNYFYTSAFLPW